MVEINSLAVGFCLIDVHGMPKKLAQNLSGLLSQHRSMIVRILRSTDVTVVL